jgi:hypothetical protein
MDPFVRRLVERLLDPKAPLSRNRHFATFDNSEGRQALRISKRLKSVHRDLVSCTKAGGRSTVQVTTAQDGRVRVELRLEQVDAVRVTVLDEGEYEILKKLGEAG